MIPDGVTLIGGSPKGGKSKLIGQLCQDITHRKTFLGNPGWPTRFGHVLLITKDDSWGSAQERLQKVLRSRDELPTGMLNIQTDWPTFAKGGLEQIERWLKDFPDTSAVILDTLQLVAPLSVRYGKDYQAIHDLSELGHKYGTAVIAALHPNKSGIQRNRKGRPWHSDFAGSGTAGADVLLGVDRVDPEPTGTLLITGKNIKSGAMPLAFDGETWTLAGELSEIPETTGLSDHRQEIMEVVARATQGLTPTQVAERIPGKTYDNIKTTLWRMDDDRQLVNFHGCYFTEANLKALLHPPDPQLSFEEAPGPPANNGRGELTVVA